MINSKYFILYCPYFPLYHDINFSKVNLLCENMFFLFMIYNLPNDIFDFSGIKIGSNPHPPLQSRIEIFPQICPEKSSISVPSLYTKMDLKKADRSDSPFISFRIPLFPIVAKLYDEYWPGKPFKDLINNPSSSIIIGCLT